MNKEVSEPRRNPKITSKIMASVKGKDTQVEIALRKVLFERGFRFRKNVPDLPGKPDIVFGKQKLAIFVDGDFWHGNAWIIRGYRSLEAMFPAEKRGFWVPKIKMNMQRDEEVNTRLRDLGWGVLRFWESEVRADINKCAETIGAAIRDRSGQ